MVGRRGLGRAAYLSMYLSTGVWIIRSTGICVDGVTRLPQHGGGEIPRPLREWAGEAQRGASY